MTTVAMPVTSKILRESSLTTSFKVLTAEQGDGYSQAAPKGLNSKQTSSSIKWGSLTLAEKNTIVDALNTVGAWGVLTWTPCYDSVEKRFRMTEAGYQVSVTNGTTFSVTCQIKEVFIP